jgi:hypothetical protein
VLDKQRISDGNPDIGMFEAQFATTMAKLGHARDNAGVYAETRKRALEELVESTREATLRKAL